MADFLESFVQPVDTSATDSHQDDNVDIQDDAAVDDDADTSTDDTTDVADDAQASDDAGDDTTPTDQQESVGDGRTIPTALKELIKAHPEQAKLLKDLWFTNSRYGKFGKVAEIQKLKEVAESFGSVEDLTSLKETLDIVGGTQGLTDMQQSLQQYQGFEQQFDAGDPAFVKQLATSNPEAFAKQAPNFLMQFGTDHPEAYNHLMAQVLQNTMISNGMLNGFALMEQAIASGNVQQVAQIYEQMKQSVSAIGQLAAQAPAPKQADPQRQKFDTERQQFDRQRQEVFTNDVAQSNESWMQPLVKKELSGYLKGRELPEGGVARLYSAVCEDVRDILQQNKSFMQRREALMKRQDKEGLIKLWKESTTKLWGNSVRKIAREFGMNPLAKKGNAAAAARPGQTQTTQQPNRAADAGFEKITKYPDVKDVLRNHSDYYKLAEQDKFILKNGKKVQVVAS